MEDIKKDVIKMTGIEEDGDQMIVMRNDVIAVMTIGHLVMWINPATEMMTDLNTEMTDLKSEMMMIDHPITLTNLNTEMMTDHLVTRTDLITERMTEDGEMNKAKG